MKISKARLQQLILEEVAKHKKLSEDASEADIQNARMTPELIKKAEVLAIEIENAVESATDDTGQAEVLKSILLSQIQAKMGQK
jgi:hypothetical protein